MGIKSKYKKTDVGIIPEDWETKPLFKVVIPATGQVDPKQEPYRSMVLVAPDHVESGTGRLLEKRIAAEQGAISGKYLFKPGDILYSKIRPYLRKAVLVDFQGLCSADMYPLSPAKNISSAFVHAVLLGHHFSTFAVNASARSGIPKINRDELAQYNIALPPYPEQRAIAKILGDVDSLIESLEKLIVKKRNLKQAVMQQLLTGKTRLRGCSEKMDGKSSVVKPGYKRTEVGVMPEDWEIDQIGNAFEISGGLSASHAQLGTKGYCYLHYGDIHKSPNSHIDVSAEYSNIPKLDIPLNRISRKSLLSDGDIVFVDASEDDIGTSKHLVIVNTKCIPFISGLHTIVLKSKNKEYDNLYKKYCFQTDTVRRQFYYYAVGTKVSGVNKTTIKKIFILKPPLPEQRAIAEVLSDMDADIESIKQRLDKTHALKQGMMQELLTGRIRLI